MGGGGYLALMIVLKPRKQHLRMLVVLLRNQKPRRAQVAQKKRAAVHLRVKAKNPLRRLRVRQARVPQRKAQVAPKIKKKRAAVHLKVKAKNRKAFSNK